MQKRNITFVPREFQLNGKQQNRGYMKKIFLFLLCATGFTCLNAQSDEGKYYVYGVDFTQAKVYAAQESPQQFAVAFEKINRLLIMEPRKYDFSRMLGRIPEVIIEPMLKRNSATDFQNLITLTPRGKDIDYPAIIGSYSLPQTEGTGVVLIAKLLDKPNKEATYDLITFNIATREILSKKEVVGKVRGFGLRNYWASSIYRILKFNEM